MTYQCVERCVLNNATKIEQNNEYMRDIKNKSRQAYPEFYRLQIYKDVAHYLARSF